MVNKPIYVEPFSSFKVTMPIFYIIKIGYLRYYAVFETIHLFFFQV